MKKSSIIGILVVIVIIGLGYYFYSNNYDSTAKTNNEVAESYSENTTANTDEVTATTTKEENTSLSVSVVQNTTSPAIITYTPTGFSPSTVTIKQGQTVTFVNQSGKKMWIGSAIHPTHEKYSGTTLSNHCPDTTLNAFDQCATGDIYSFIFKKVGTWGYHNHVSSGDRGVIVVTE